MAGLNGGIIKEMPVPLPPIKLQAEFIHKLEAVDKLKSVHLFSLSNTNTFFASLQHQAFRGEL